MAVKKKLLDIIRDKIRYKKHPVEMAKGEIEDFLTYLATNKKVSPSTQNQAFSAMLFLYKMDVDYV